MHDDDGLQASLPSFRRYALAAFPEAYGRRVSITVRRDDPPPGEEAQVDYGRLGKWTDPKTGETMILNAFILVLSFSRHMFVAVVRRMDAATWLDCHVRAFAFLRRRSQSDHPRQSQKRGPAPGPVRSAAQPRLRRTGPSFWLLDRPSQGRKTQR